MYSADIKRLSRNFLPQNFTVTDWASLALYFEQLMAINIDSLPELKKWLQDLSELEAVISEDACWRQIRMTCDTENKELEDAYNFFCTDIQPHIQPYADALNKKLLASKALDQLNPDEYFTYLRSIRKSIDLFREENIPLQSEISVLQQQYGQITGDMMIVVNGREYTLQQAAKFLENPDRTIRQQVYEQMQERRLQDKEKLDILFDKLIDLRNREAHNAGFENYRDYRFKELGRFDYTKEDCFRFHEAVKLHVMPLVNNILEQKKIKLGLENLRPWDLDAEPVGTDPLHPFENGKELLEKSVACFNKLNPFFGDCLVRMDQMKHFDLESRKGKSPGGYNCPLPESGAPFIFMNAAGQMSDLTTMVHEGGHAIHSFLSHPLALTGFKEVPMEIAEVASMAMELFSMDEWGVFFKDEQELKRAKIHQLERVITIFPWIAAIDKFQHKIYESPHHTHQERTAIWVQVLQEFTDDIVDYSGLEKYRQNAWQRQLHLYEVPFYYIEYGIAQLGAIGMWMQFRENKKQALDNYCRALSFGGTRTLPELYAAAGIEFNFTSQKIKGLMEFVNAEMEKLEG
ncbi:MAG: M3 family oligoendopeptidase [Niastella sp.]|nr:M3 family oligoendopeptidase [Niastella sp.]